MISYNVQLLPLPQSLPRWEREVKCRSFCGVANLLPLPPGEGWGGGEVELRGDNLDNNLCRLQQNYLLPIALFASNSLS
jgi:hypothetical protein